MDDRLRFGLSLALNAGGAVMLITAIGFWPTPADIEPAVLGVGRVLAGLFGLTFMMAGGYAANQVWTKPS